MKNDYVEVEIETSNEAMSQKCDSAKVNTNWDDEERINFIVAVQDALEKAVGSEFPHPSAAYNEDGEAASYWFVPLKTPNAENAVFDLFFRENKQIKTTEEGDATIFFKGLDGLYPSARREVKKTVMDLFKNFMSKEVPEEVIDAALDTVDIQFTTNAADVKMMTRLF